MAGRAFESRLFIFSQSVLSLWLIMKTWVSYQEFLSLQRPPAPCGLWIQRGTANCPRQWTLWGISRGTEDIWQAEFPVHIDYPGGTSLIFTSRRFRLEDSNEWLFPKARFLSARNEIHKRCWTIHLLLFVMEIMEERGRLKICSFLLLLQKKNNLKCMARTVM